jgi:RNA polymerase sigma-70 factor (ECF subfamily)
MSRFTRINIEPDVVAALQRGDRSAAAEIYRALSGVVHTLALRLLADAQLAKEVTQDTFVDVIEHADTLKAPEAFVGWVRSVAINHCLMRRRSPWHRLRTLMIETDRADGASDSARLDGFGDIERALRQLSATTRFVVWMHDVEGYTHAEIAQMTGRTESYSKSQLARGYARLLAWRTEKADDTTDDTDESGRIARCATETSGGGASG